jgi:cell division transport system permease protein
VRWWRVIISKIQSIPAFKPDIALARDESSRFLPWIITLMVYLTALTLACGFTLHHTVVTSHDAQVESFSVHLPHQAEKADDITAKALATIKNASGVSSAYVMSPERIKEMVEPWLGKSDALLALPLPTIIEAKTIAGNPVDFIQLKIKLSSIAPGADIDNHKQWLEQFSNLVHLLQWILFSIAFFILFATSTIVVFACKTSLKIHRSTVNLLHRLGAFDSYIAHQFQHYSAVLAFKGAFIGSGLAAGTLLGIHLMARQINSPLFPSFHLLFQHWLIFFSLPLIMSFIALVSARFSVLATLRKLP